MKSILLTILLAASSAYGQSCCLKVPHTESKGKSLSVLKSYKWPNGATLRIKFLDGSASQIKEAKKHFDYIDSLCGIKLKYVLEGESEIRVSFSQSSGHWSYLGKSCLQISQQEKTMNLQLTSGFFGSSKEEWNRVAQHEFLHALGFVHEHAKATAEELKWNREVVYKYYAATQGWSRKQTDQQVLFRYAIGSTIGSEFDKNSIMLYPIPKGHANIVIGWNSKMSALDIKTLQEIYPIK